jgi:hypothetical protein
MELITISFPNVSQMAYFIIDCGLSDFEPDWSNSSLSGYIGDTHLKKALEQYDACQLQEKEAVIQNECFY